MNISKPVELSLVIELREFSETISAISEATENTLGVFIDPVNGELNSGLVRTENQTSVVLSGLYSGVFRTTIKYFEEGLVTSDGNPNAETEKGFKELKERYPDLAAKGEVVQPTITNDVLSIPTHPPQTLFHYSMKNPLTVVIPYQITVYYEEVEAEPFLETEPITREEHEGDGREGITSQTFQITQTVDWDESVPYNTIKRYYP
jgi:hypothetical protein